MTSENIELTVEGLAWLKKTALEYQARRAEIIAKGLDPDEHVSAAGFINSQAKSDFDLIIKTKKSVLSSGTQASKPSIRHRKGIVINGAIID